jgi:dihydropteroate synthase
MTISEFYQHLSDPQQPTLIMGILNVTPDSFSDGGQYLDIDKAVARVLEMEAEGAEIIDIGGESTRPGAEPVSLQRELERVLPVIERLALHSHALLSIDTYKAEVAEQALAAGAHLVNDISGLRFDPQMAPLVARTQVPVVIMHIKGTPREMQVNPTYENFMQEMIAYFHERVEFCRSEGIKNDQIILDPGIGFGKRLKDNFELLRRLDEIVQLGFPVLVGPSRKSFIGKTLDLPVDQRLEGTAAAVTAAILKGARIIRVHDVREMKRVAVISDNIRAGSD